MKKFNFTFATFWLFYVFFMAYVGFAVVSCAHAKRAAAAQQSTTSAHTVPQASDPEPVTTGPADTDGYRRRAEWFASKYAAAEQDYENSQTEKIQHRLDVMRDTCLWVAGVMLLGFLVSVALTVIAPAGFKGMAAKLGAAAGAVGMAALMLYRALGYVERLLPWLVVIAIAVAAIGLVWWILHTDKLKKSVAEAASYGERMENVLAEVRKLLPDGARSAVDNLIGQAKAVSAADQEATGVRGLIAAVRGKDPAPEGKAAA